MMPFHSLLTAAGTAQGGGSKAPLILAVVFGAILLIAFCIGLKKGARRVSWTGTVWLAAGLIFLLLQKYLGAKIGDALSTKVTFLGETVRPYLGTLVLALAAVIGTLILYGVFTLIFRPKIKWKKKNSDRYTLDADGVEYDEDYYDYDDYEDYEDRMEMVRKGYGTPSVGGRLLGGLFCAVNAGMLLAVAAGIALLLLNGTGLKTVWSGFFGNATVQNLVSLAGRYAFDLLLIGILVAFACKGRKNGFVETLRTLLVNLGSIALVVAGFYLPFKTTATGVAPAGAGGMIFRFVARCETAVVSMGDSVAQFAPIIAKIVAGFLLAIAFIAALLLINWLLKLAVKGISKVGFLRTVDGSVACVIYLVVGVAVCAVILALFAVLAYYGVFDISNFFAGETTLSNAAFEACRAYIDPMLKNFGAGA
ncbi:MAG: hypothetical protein IJX91_04440 [Clostridia bacterium]|nr:hypothetical protein [Clostridia bacterium]